MTRVLLANIDIDDVARAEAFHVAALGLAIGRRFGDKVLSCWALRHRFIG